MKTFDEKDLITWSNRHKAKNNSRGYFANCIYDLKDDIEHDKLRTLVDISDDYDRCFDCYSSIDSEIYSFSFFLPKDAIKKEKTYRACRNVKELYELVTNFKSKMSDEECICDLIGTTIHFRGKYQNEFYTMITQMRIINGKHLIGLNGATFSFNELFNSFEIEINGEWKPFGVEA